MKTLDEIIRSQDGIFPSPIRSICETYKFIAELYGIKLPTRADYKREKRRIYRRQRQNKR